MTAAVTGRSGDRYHLEVTTTDTLVQLGHGEFTPTAGWVELDENGQPVEAVFIGPWVKPSLAAGVSATGIVRYIGVELGPKHLHRWRPIVRTAVAAALLASQG